MLASAIKEVCILYSLISAQKNPLYITYAGAEVII